MNKPILNPVSEKLIKSVIGNLPQSLLITGPDGVGISTIGFYIADQLKTTPTIVLPEKDEKVDIDTGVIGIDIIRRLYKDTKTISVGRQIVIIDFAERMTIQAQNAFLKLLEEPGIDIHFILISHSSSKLLLTILSRTEKIDIKPISATQSNEFLDLLGIKDARKRSQMIFIAEGLPAELSRLADDEEYFERRSAMIRDARELLQGKTYQKLLIAQAYKDDRASALILLMDMTNILKKTLIDTPNADAIMMLDHILDAYRRIEANGNIRLSITRMIT